jgi:hypothetical protein
MSDAHFVDIVDTTHELFKEAVSLSLFQLTC